MDSSKLMDSCFSFPEQPWHTLSKSCTGKIQYNYLWLQAMGNAWSQKYNCPAQGSRYLGHVLGSTDPRGCLYPMSRTHIQGGLGMIFGRQIVRVAGFLIQL